MTMLRERYVVPAAVAVCSVLLLLVPPGGPSARAVETISPERVTAAAAWRRPSPDPMGIAYHAASGNLVIVDSEVEETRLWAGANVWSITTSAHPTRSWRTTRYSDEPTDVAFRGARTMFVADDVLNRIFVVATGQDRRFGTRDDAVRSFSTELFGSENPQGLTYGGGSLWVTDASSATVHRLDPGADRRFDGGSRRGDDVVTSFTTRAAGVTFPTGCAFDAATGHLLLVSQNSPSIVVVTTNGETVTSFDIGGSGIVYPSGIELAPSSTDPTVTSAFVTDRGIDNDFDDGGNPDENDGRIFEFVLDAA